MDISYTSLRLRDDVSLAVKETPAEVMDMVTLNAENDFIAFSVAGTEDKVYVKPAMIVSFHRSTPEGRASFKEWDAQFEEKPWEA